MRYVIILVIFLAACRHPPQDTALKAVPTARLWCVPAILIWNDKHYDSVHCFATKNLCEHVVSAAQRMGGRAVYKLGSCSAPEEHKKPVQVQPVVVK